MRLLLVGLTMLRFLAQSLGLFQLPKLLNLPISWPETHKLSDLLKKSLIATLLMLDAMEVTLKKPSTGLSNKVVSKPTLATHTLLKTAHVPKANAPQVLTSKSRLSPQFRLTKVPSTAPFNPPHCPSAVMLNHGKTTKVVF
jgi:uncharacterized membrane protein YcgQ (UPF0703/DUF1980 family)